MEHVKKSRREFVKTAAGITAGLTVGGILPGFSASSYRQIIGSNEKIKVSVVGVNARGKALAQNFASQPNCEVAHICDVDNRAIPACIAEVVKRQNPTPTGFGDFRKSLESKDIDAVVIAMPDHWHAPAALLSLKAGKNVYVEKPCSHNPAEGEILVKATKKYGKVVQMGNQRRSWPNVIKGIEELKNGTIGRVYFGKGWYTNNRESIGTGKVVPVPEWLNWDLWQGPAPRRAFKDNFVHYNWHWFWHWGTGEALNNGTHMVDLMRWGLGVDYPIRVSSNGGRYHFHDDWETPDTQVISFDFPGGVTMTWEGRSCNPKNNEGSSTGAIFFGEKGSLYIQGGNNYMLFDLKGNVIKEIKEEKVVDARNKVNPSELLDALHIQNFFSAIKNGESLNSGIVSGHKSTLLVQLGNIAQRVGRSLETDPADGHIKNDPEANKLWSREYEKGWEMKI